MITTKTIDFGHSGQIKLVFENDGGSDTSVTIESTNFKGEHLWVNEDHINDFTDEFKELIEKYFI